jgi:hypothetical protein
LGNDLVAVVIRTRGSVRAADGEGARRILRVAEIAVYGAPRTDQSTLMGGGNYLFVYGSLRAGREDGRLLDPFTISRSKMARVPGELRRGGQARPRARFDPGLETVVVGELLTLAPDRVSEALSVCGRYGRDDYRLVTVEVDLGDERLAAHALEWISELEDASEHLAAATMGVKVAQYHCYRLAQVGLDDPRERVIFHAHTQGVLDGGASASGELAMVFNLLLGCGLEHPTPRTLLTHATAELPRELAETLGWFRAWWDEPLVRDADELRSLTTRHHYDRSPRGRQWVFEEVALRGDAEPYLGPRGVLSYCVKYVTTLERLESVVQELNRLVGA